MSLVESAFVAVIFFAVAFIIFGLWRFITLRSTGATILLRRLPAKGPYSWRHGIVRYTPTQCEVFKLRSVSLTADLKFNRLTTSIVDYRQLEDDEVSFMPDKTEAVHLRCGDKDYELALDKRSVLALNTWLESAPSPRREHFDFSHYDPQNRRTSHF